VAESVLRRFARLLGGVVLTQGHLGHQVLGQLLIFDATEVEVAGANLAVAATERQRSAFAQMAIRTAVPALAVHALLRNREKRLEAREQRLADRISANQDLEASYAELQSSHAGAAEKLAVLDAEDRKLREELAALQAKTAASPDEARVPPPVKEGGDS
jgi:ABC-type phosphate transport system auxiliary subunit